MAGTGLKHKASAKAPVTKQTEKFMPKTSSSKATTTRTAALKTLTLKATKAATSKMKTPSSKMPTKPTTRRSMCTNPAPETDTSDSDSEPEKLPQCKKKWHVEEPVIEDEVIDVEEPDIKVISDEDEEVDEVSNTIFI